MHTVDHPPPSRQRGPHNDPTLLDGDSAHGSPDVLAGDEWAVDTDTDVTDAAPDDPLEEAVDGHTPDAEAERMEEDADAGEVSEGEDLEGTEDEETPDGEAGEVEGDEEDADINAEGDAREPEPVETTLEVELNKEMDRDSTPASTPKARQTRDPKPVPGYSRMTMPKVMELAATMTAEQRAELLAFERAHKNRVKLVAALEAMANG